MKVEQVGLVDGVLKLVVEGTLNTTTAEEFFETVRDLRDKSACTLTELDIENVDFISSAGLRALLWLMKNGRLRCVGVSPEIMEVFEDTGFSSMMETYKRLRTLSVEGCDVIGSGANGSVYRLDGETVVKVFQEGTPLEDVERERSLSRLSLIHGVPTAISYEVVKVGNAFGAVYELVDAETLSVTMKGHPDAFESYAKQYVSIFKGFHKTHVSPDDFPAAKGIYHANIDGCADWYDAGELALLHRIVESVPERDTLTHGDYHPNNIMVTKSELIMIDMGDVSYGHPVFDFLATAATQANLVDLNPAYAEIHTRMPVDMIRRLWNYLLDNYFDDRTAGEVARIDAQVRLFSKLKVALAPVVGRGIPRELIEASVMDAKQNLLTRADELIGAIDW